MFFETIKGLRERGHEVSEFSVSRPDNLPSDYSAYFAPPLPELSGKHDPATAWKIFKRLFRSSETEQKLGALVLAVEPEVAHLHNVYHHLSASTFIKLRELKIPVVLTVHDVFPLCPNHSMLRGETLCEKCYKNKLYNCAFYRCVDNKFLPSAAAVLEAYYYRFKKIWDNIDCYICPSRFMADKLAEYGFPAEKIRVTPNPFKPQTIIPPLGDKIVYLGRVHYEKGIKILMEAAKELRDFKILVAGHGPEDKWVQEFARKNTLSQVERMGWVGGDLWEKAMLDAKVIVVPSLFFENCSMSILEAFSYGRIVVSVDRGGNPELIKDGVSGFLAKPEDSADLARVIRRAMSVSDEEAAYISANAIKTLKQNHRSEDYFDRLEKIYAEVARKK